MNTGENLPRPSHDADAYDVRERIAIGTSAIVYRAVERDSDMEVLFKVLQPEGLAHPLDVDCVLSRRAQLSRVKHENVAQLLDVFEDEEGCVLVYNYMAGKGAHLVPKESMLTQAEARKVALQLCEALFAAEEADCPHGEIKPSNIVIARNGSGGPVVQVQDWGLSVCRKGEPPEESLLFMAPERLEGGEPDFSSDLFSVGATLIFLLTGHVPVQGTSRAELLASWKGFEIAALPPLRPDLEASFVQWIGWLMRYKPRDRPETVEKACEVLDKVIAYGEALDKRHEKKAAAALEKEQPKSPGTQRSAAPRVQLPGGAPTATRPAPKPAQQQPAPGTAKSPLPPAKSSEPVANRVFRWAFIAFALCGLCAVGAWLYDQRAEIEWPWKHSDEKSSSTAAPVEQPMTVAAPPAAPKAAPPVVAAAPPAPPLDVREKFLYTPESDLNGAATGTGWTGPWNATNSTVRFQPQTKAMYVSLGGVQASSMQRVIGNTDTLTAGGICFAARIWHPGAIAPAALLDLLDDGSGKDAAPVMIAPDGDKLKITILGGKGEITQPASKEFKLAVCYTFKLNSNNRHDVQMGVAGSPAPKGRAPTCALLRKDVALPATLSFIIKTQGTAERGFSVNELHIARTLQDALK